MRAAAIALLLVLAACAGIEPVKIPEKASVAAAVACIDEDAKRELDNACPVLRTDADILALDDFKIMQSLRADRGKAAVCIAKLQAAVAVCAKVPAAGLPPPLDGRRERGGAGGDPASADPHS